MESKKRFINTFIWESPFFHCLTNSEKLFFIYLNHKCDNIGYWEPNLKLAKYHVGEFDENGFVEKVNKSEKRIAILKDGAWFLTKFVKFQYAHSNPLNPKNRAHKSYINLMIDKNLFDWFLENEPEIMVLANEYVKKKRTLKEPSESYKEKEEEEEADKEQEEAGEQEKDTSYYEYGLVLGKVLKQEFKNIIYSSLPFGIDTSLSVLFEKLPTRNYSEIEAEVFNVISEIGNPNRSKRIDVEIVIEAVLKRLNKEDRSS